MSEFKFRLDKEQLESELNGVATGYPPSKEWVNHIRCLIENMDKKVNREFVQRYEGLIKEAWSMDWPILKVNEIKRILDMMLAELGHEVEEEEEK